VHIAENEAEPVLLRMLGRVRMLQGRPAEAVRLLKRALQVHSDSSHGISVSPAEEIAFFLIALLQSMPPMQMTMRRRRYFRPETESSDNQDTGGQTGNSPDCGAAATTQEKTLHTVDSVLPPYQKSDAQPAQLGVPCDRVTAPAELEDVLSSIESDAQSSSEFFDRTQAEFDFELSDDDFEDEAQRQFEENLKGVRDEEDYAEEPGEEEEAGDESDLIVDFPAVEESEGHPSLDAESS